MKCKYCGGEIRLEDLVCPYCGRPNEEAQRHAQDMRRYQYEFQKTKQDVTEKAGQASKRAVRIGAIALLLLAIGANIILQLNSYHIGYAIERANEKKHASEYLANAEAYLAEEDYLGFVSYCSASDMSMSSDLYNDIYPVYRVGMYYQAAVHQMMKLVNLGKYDSVDSFTKYLSEDVEDFYESIKNESSYEPVNETAAAHIESMKESLEVLFTAYLGMTPEEAAGMEDLTRAGRALLIERGTESYREAADHE